MTDFDLTPHNTENLENLMTALIAPDVRTNTEDHVWNEASRLAEIAIRNGHAVTAELVKETECRPHPYKQAKGIVVRATLAGETKSIWLVNRYGKSVRNNEKEYPRGRRYWDRHCKQHVL